LICIQEVIGSTPISSTNFVCIFIVNDNKKMTKSEELL